MEGSPTKNRHKEHHTSIDEDNGSDKIACISKGTILRTRYKTIPIERITQGTEVEVVLIDRHSLRYKGKQTLAVKRLIHKQYLTKGVGVYTTEKGTNVCTPDHPILLNREWCTPDKLPDLKLGPEVNDIYQLIFPKQTHIAVLEVEGYHLLTLGGGGEPSEEHEGKSGIPTRSHTTDKP